MFVQARGPGGHPRQRKYKIRPLLSLDGRALLQQGVGVYQLQAFLGRLQVQRVIWMEPDTSDVPLRMPLLL